MVSSVSRPTAARAVAVGLAVLLGAATLVVGILPGQAGQPEGALHVTLASLRTSVTSPAGGYWVVDAVGRVTAFGGAANYGSAPGHLNQPIVGIVSTGDGLGYWLVARDGGVFAFGDAPYSGNAMSTSSNGSVVGITSVPGHGATGPQGAPGIPGAQGIPGVAGTPGAQGIQGLTGLQGLPGIPGLAGTPGVQGTPGATGAQGAPGTPGSPGANGLMHFAEFFGLAPPDNSASVAPGSAVQFPLNGPSDGLITRASSSQFLLPSIGTYQVYFQVPVTEGGQLVVGLDSGGGTVELAYTVVGRGAGATQIVETTLIQTTVVDAMLSVRNPAGESIALTITPLAGGVDPASSSIVIEQVG